MSPGVPRRQGLCFYYALHAFHALLWRRQARRCWREQLSFLACVLQHPREPRHEFVAQA